MRINRGVKITGIVLGTLVGLVVLLALFGFFLPNHVQLVNISATLDASSTELFPFFNSRAGQQRMWSQGAQRLGISPMNIADLGGPDAGVGTRLGFFPDETKLGFIGRALAPIIRGRGVILESEPDHKVVIEIDFGMVVAVRTMDLEALSDSTTQVSWSERLEITNPLMRYLPLLVGSSVNESFKQVLIAVEEVAIADRSMTP